MPPRVGRASLQVVRKDEAEPMTDETKQPQTQAEVMAFRCKRCAGEGWIGLDDCPDCGGTGLVDGEG